MSQNRAISKASPVSGATFTADAADTVNYLSSLSGGVGVTPAGANAYTMDLDVDAGFTGPSSGMLLSFKVPNANNSACTIDVENTGTKAFVKINGDAFSGGELVAGTLVTCLFLGGADDEWRLISTRSTDAIGNYPLIYFEAFSAPGSDTWTAPWDCDALFICIGAGGSGRVSDVAPAHGGGAGGFAQKFIQGISQNETASVVVGEGGEGVSVSNGSVDGNDGGSSTVSSTDFTLSLSCAGGEAGTSTGPGDGGTGTGGDENHTGGNGGTATGNSAAGGGAVGVFGAGNNGGDTAGNNEAADGASVIRPVPLSHPYLDTNGDGSDGAYSASVVASSRNASPLCGSGGAMSGAAVSISSGNAGTGAGSGGAFQGSDATSGDGGDGLVLVAYTANKAA